MYDVCCRCRIRRAVLAEVRIAAIRARAVIDKRPQNRGQRVRRIRRSWSTSASLRPHCYTNDAACSPTFAFHRLGARTATRCGLWYRPTRSTPVNRVTLNMLFDAGLPSG
jgi:hypothetical protein